MGERLFSPLAQLSERYRGAGLENDGGDNVFTSLSSGHADGGDVGHARHGAYGVLHLGGVDVETGGIDHLLAAVRHVDETVAHLDQVAGAQPAVGREDFGGFVVLIPVAGKDLRARCDEFADVAVGNVVGGILGIDDTHARGGERQAERPACARGSQGRAEEDRRGLGHAITFDHETAGRLLPFLG